MRITVYGADWCSMTKEALAHLKRLGLPFHYIDIETDREAAKFVRSHADGREKKPTIQIGDTVLVEPSSTELSNTLHQLNLVAKTSGA